MPQQRSASSALPVSQASIQDALRRAMRDERGRAALRISPGGQPEAQLLAFAMLRETASVKGGTLLELAPDDWLLTELPALEAGKLHALLIKILGPAAAQLLPLPASKGVLAGILGDSRVPHVLEVPAAEPVPPLGLDAALDRLLPGQVYQRQGIVVASGGPLPRLVFQRLVLDEVALRQALGAYAEDRAFLHHARALLYKRALEALGDEGTRKSLLGGGPIAPLMLDLPASLLPAPPEPSGDAPLPSAAPALYATFALHEAIALPNLASRREALHQESWGIAIAGLSAASLGLVDAEALPADWLILQWSPALDDTASLKALRRLDQTRLVLDACDGAAALSWGLSQGIQLFAGPWIEEVIAARRMEKCDASAGCTRAECRARGLATSPQGRIGCHRPLLLEAVLPEVPA